MQVTCSTSRPPELKDVAATCPLCSAPLNVLRGPDGYAVDVVAQTDPETPGYVLRGARLVERRRFDTIVTCSGCEYAR